MILLNAYNDPKAAKWLSERVHAPAVVLPFSVGGSPGAKDLFGLFDDTIDTPARSRSMNLFSTEVSILWPALIAGILVVISHVPLGQQVFARGIVFIDLAIAQVAGLGVIAASGFGLPIEGWTAQAAAGAAALAGALLLTWTERKRPEAQEALIGILFVLASAAQILLLANDPHGGENLKDLLSGQILWVSQRAAPAHRDPDGGLRRRLVPLARADRPDRLLPAVRARGDRLRADGRRLPRVHEPDRAGGRDLPVSRAGASSRSATRSASRATSSGSRSRSSRTCPRAR